jgi:small GTP-binding protein domain
MTTRCGYVALLGRPNAGKSTLLNQAVGAKVSIVTPKAQTTRFRVSGIVMRQTAQIVLIDTPGLFAPKRRLDRAMVAAAWDSVAGADLACMLVDAFRARPDDLAEPLEALARTGRKRWLILNKIDLLPREKLLPLAETLAKAGSFVEVFMISALKRDGIDHLLDAMGKAMPKARTFIRKTNSPTRPTACSPPNWSANRYSCSSARKFPTAPRSKPKASRTSPTARHGST